MIKNKDVQCWLENRKSVHTLQQMRAIINKRIKELMRHDESPFKDIPIEKKREVIGELFDEE